MSHFHKTGEEVECLTCNPSLGGGGFRAIRDVLSQTGDAAVKHEQQALDLAKAGKVDVKDLKAAFPYTSSTSRIESLLPNTERKSTRTSSARSFSPLGFART